MELPPCPGTEQQHGRTDRQTDKLPAQLCLRGLSYHLLLGEGNLSADPNIAAAAARRSQNICGARQHEPAGLLCARQVQEIQQSRSRRRGSAAASPAPVERRQRVGPCRAAGSVSQLTTATQDGYALPREQPGCCSGWGRGWEGAEPVGFSTGSAAQGLPTGSSVPAGVATGRGHCCPLCQAGGVGRLARGAGAAGQSVARDGQELELCPSPKADPTEQPSGWRDFRHQNTDLSQGGKKPAQLNFVPFNTRVITTSGNLPPTQLCARINWKSIITITNNSLLAFIASSAWGNSHQWLPTTASL